MRRSSLLLATALIACSSPGKPPVATTTSDGWIGATGSAAAALEASFMIDGAQLSHVPAVCFTPDGTRLVCGTAEGELLQFDVATRAVVDRRKAAETAIEALGIDRRGAVMAWRSAEGTLEARMLGAEGEVLAHAAGIGSAGATALSPAGDRIALARGAVVEIRSISELGETRRSRELGAEVNGIAWRPDGGALAAVTRAGRLVVFAGDDLEVSQDVATGQPLYAVAWSPDGKRLAFGGEANQVEVLEEDGARRTLIKGQPYWITALGFAPQGDLIAIGDESCDVWLIDSTSGERRFHGKHHSECWLTQVAWAPDGSTFLFGCRPNSLAGKPSPWTANQVAEASRDPVVAQAQADEQAALESLRTQLSQEQAALLAQLDRPAVGGGAGVLGFEESPGPELGLSSFGDVEVNQTGVIPVAPLEALNSSAVAAGNNPRGLGAVHRAAPDLSALRAAAQDDPAALAALERWESARKTRAAALEKALQQVQGQFQIPTWKAKR